MAYLHEEIKRLQGKSKKKLKLFQGESRTKYGGGTEVMIVANDKKIARKIMEGHFSRYGDKIKIRKEKFEEYPSLFEFEGVY